MVFIVLPDPFRFEGLAGFSAYRLVQDGRELGALSWRQDRAALTDHFARRVSVQPFGARVPRKNGVVQG
jgi:hypothetical protein